VVREYRPRNLAVEEDTGSVLVEGTQSMLPLDRTCCKYVCLF